MKDPHLKTSFGVYVTCSRIPLVVDNLNIEWFLFKRVGFRVIIQKSDI